MKFYIYILLIIISGYYSSVNAQVTINNSIHFTSDTVNIDNLSNPSDTTNTVPLYSSAGENLLNFSQTTNNWSINLFDYASPKTGMTFIISLNQPITDTISLFFNSTGPYDIYYNQVKLNQNSGVQRNIKITFIDTAFFALEVNERKCPNGFIKINSQYCIEIAENSPSSYNAAIDNCENKKAKLCTWSQWFYACQKLNSTFPNFTDNWEFIDDASDHTQLIDIVGTGGSCFNNTSQPTSTPQTYRCCYDF